MPTRVRTSPIRPLAAFGALVTALVAALLVSVPTTAVPAADETVSMQFTSTLKSAFKDEHTDGNRSYGVTILKGKARIDRKTVKLERISTYNYLDGSGPVSGFLTMSWGKGTHIAFNVVGSSTRVNGATQVEASLNSFEADGKWAGYTASGTMVGVRKGPIGKPVTYLFNITLVQG